MPVLRPLDPDERRHIGSYRLLGILGQGGQGVVYLAAPGEGAKVAIKVLRPDMVDNSVARDRFLREVQAAQKVADFCTARVLDVGVDANQLYVVSEFIDGESLHRRVRLKGPLTAGELTRLGIGTAAALVAIHNAGIVHRDFKPENIILGPDGPRVVDFGIARALDGTTTQTGHIGTPPYMSPEQIRGESVGTKSDIFSWAGTMTFASTGRPPFCADNIQAIMYRIMNKEPDIRDVPHEIHDLLLSCLSKEPQARPSARDLLLLLTGSDRNFTEAPAPPQMRESPVSTTSPENDRRAVSRSSRDSSIEQPLAGRLPHLSRLSRLMIAITLGVVALAIALVLLRLHNSAEPALARGDIQVADNIFTASEAKDNGIIQTINAVASSGSTVVAVGGDMRNQPPRPVFLVSVDGGRKWGLGHQSVDLTTPVGPVDRVAGGDGRWLAVSTTSTAIPGIWTSVDGRIWRATSPASTASFSSRDRIADIARTSYGFVAVGATALKDGTAGPVAWFSPDGRSWTRVGSEQIGRPEKVRGIRAVVARGDKVVALADPATGNSVSILLRSNDGGRSWLRTAAALSDMRPEQGTLSVSKKNGFLLVQTHEKSAARDVPVYCSRDGSEWNHCGLIGKLGAEGVGVLGLTASTAGIAAVAESEPGRYEVFTSDDARTWTRSADLGELLSTIHGLTITDAGLLVVGGDTPGWENFRILNVAEKGKSAHVVPLDAALGRFSLPTDTSALAVSEQALMVVGSSYEDAAIWTSDNSGADWKSLSLEGAAGPRRQALADAVHGPAGWLAVGSNMRDAAVTGPLFLSSKDGKSWKTGPNIRIPSGNVQLVPTAVTASDRGYVIVGQDLTSSEARPSVWFTADLKKFVQSPTSELPDGGDGVRLHDVSATPTGFVAVGGGGISTGERGIVWLSSDGLNWRAITSVMPPGTHNGSLRRTVVSGSTIVAIGTADGRPFSAVSTNSGSTWKYSWLPATQPAAALDLTATDHGFVAVGTGGGDGIAWTSADGHEWKPYTEIGGGLTGPGLQSLTAVVSLGQHVVALGRSTTDSEDHLLIWRTGLDGGQSVIPAASTRSPAAVALISPTLRIRCMAGRCPVFVRIPGGDVLADRDLTRNEDLTYFDDDLDVVLDDTSTVEVYENGTKRARGKPGERKAFSVSRAIKR